MQSQMSYAQKVKKGQAQEQQPPQRQQQQQQSQPQQPQQQQQSNAQPTTTRMVRMVPTQNILGAQASNLNMAASALSNYAYPYNYATNLPHAYNQHQHQPQHSHQHQPHHYHRNPHSQQTQHQQRRGPYASRDFFDRRVQNNVNSAVSQYYNYPPSSSPSRYSKDHKRRSHRPYGQKPSYSSSPKRSTPFKNAPNLNKMNEKRTKRVPPTESQLATYEAAADRDVLCWIYENQGKCRYGEKCQWLHLDRETGKYVPTVYIMNSLDKTTAININEEKAAPKNNNDDNINNDNIIGGNDDDKKKNKNDNNNDDDDVDHDDHQDKDNDTEELQKKFQLLMEKTIKRNLENNKKNPEDDNKEEPEPEEKPEEKPQEKVQVEEKEKEKEKEKEREVNGNEKANGTKPKGYGSYGTTFDRHNVCWEFNTFVGCRKGSKCKWAHQYLIKEASHPYTGEKLNGLAVRKFRLSHNL